MLLFLLSLLLLKPHSTCTAQSTNLTIDDSDPQVLYMPASSWRASSVSCSSCFNPLSDDIRQGTFHDGTGGLNDRMRGSNSGPGGEEEHNGPDNDNDSPMDLTAMPGVSATFSFTGTAVFVYCIVPDGTDGDHLTNSNLSFIVDGKPAGQFKRTPTQEPVTFLYNQLVFSQRDLPAAKHEVVISSPANGALLLDYVQFTQSNGEDAPADASADPTDGSHPTPQAADAKMKHRNSVSFAVAVGATVGTLSIVTFTVCVSLFYRRRRSARRLERERRDAERAQPAMDGPAPFVPRFFPRGQNDDDTSSQQTAAVSVATSSTATNDSFVPRFFPRSQPPPPSQTPVAQAAPAFVPRYFPGGPRPNPPASPPPPLTPPALTLSDELPPLPYAPQVSQRPPIQQRASPATPLLSNPASSAPAPALALPALSEEDAAVLDLLPPPDTPPPFDPVRLPSYETALIDSGSQDRSSSTSHSHSPPRTPS